MFILITITILLLAALIMVILRLWRPSFGYHWLISAGGAFAAWLMVLFSYTTIPDSPQLISWGPETAYSNSIIISLDHISWPFAAALGTLLIATILSDVVRAYDLSWSNWASSLVVIAIGLLGIFSGNLLTFILIWMAYDLIVMVILLLQLDAERLRRRTVRVFFIHLSGTLCLLIAGVISASDNSSMLLEQTSPLAILFIVIGAAFRFGALPIDSQIQEYSYNRRSFGTVRSLTSMGIVSVLLVRVAGVVENVDLAGYLWPAIFGFVGMTALLFSFAWFFARDELEGRQGWIMGFGMLIIASTLRAEVDSSLAWGITAIFTGGLIFLASVRSKISMWIALLGVIGVSTLPFTAAWSGLTLFSNPFSISLIFYFISISLLIAGYARHATNLIPEPSGLERWIKVIYPIGLIMLPIIQVGFGWLYRPEIREIPLTGWIVSLIIIVLSVLGFFWQQRGGTIPGELVSVVNSFLGFNWLRSFIVSVFTQLTRLLNFTSNILEGEGGILWVMLSIVLFLAILLITIGS
jgi:hypothetical protein